MYQVSSDTHAAMFASYHKTFLGALLQWAKQMELFGNARIRSEGNFFPDND